jgi:hypothetical protein
MEEVYPGCIDAHAYPAPLLVMMLINKNIYSLYPRKIVEEVTEFCPSLSVVGSKYLRSG